MAEAERAVVAQRLAADEWAPFGWIPVADTDAADGAHRLEFEWQDAHVNVISHAPEEVERTRDGLQCDRLYRHLTHTQVLMALNGPSVIAVAPPGSDLTVPGGTEAVRAFRLEAFESLVLHRGTWHWGPFPLGTEPVRLFNVQGFGYARDNESVDLKGAGVELTVVV